MILGYGGLVSFGHAAFFGIGGYAVGILSANGIQSGWLQWPVALAASILWAALIGALSLRTRGVYFIMITLAFAQLVYYLGSGLEAYGGDDGLNISRSRFSGLIDLRDKASFYWLCFALLLRHPVVLQPHRPFALRLRAARRAVERAAHDWRWASRSSAIAWPPSPSPAPSAGSAGILLANEGAYVSPAMMSWVKSGDLIVIVVLGGIGALFGPLYGAIAFFALEEFAEAAARPAAQGLGRILADRVRPDAGARRALRQGRHRFAAGARAMAEPLLVHRRAWSSASAACSRPTTSRSTCGRARSTP